VMSRTSRFLRVLMVIFCMTKLPGLRYSKR
jgi:hypothetical protein